MSQDVNPQPEDDDAARKPSGDASTDPDSLLARLRAGDPKAWQPIFDAQFEILRRVLRGIVPNDAENVIQDVIAQILAGKKQIKDPANAAGWLWRVMMNAALAALRKQNNITERQAVRIDGLAVDPEGSEERPLDALIDKEQRPLKEAMRSRHLERLPKCLESLSEPQRRIIEYWHFENLTYREIAEKFGFVDEKSGKPNTNLAASRLRTAEQLLLDCVDRVTPGGDLTP